MGGDGSVKEEKGTVYTTSRADSHLSAGDSI